MDTKVAIRCIIIFLSLTVTLGANSEDNVIVRLGLDLNYSVLILSAMLLTLLMISRHAFVVVAIIALSLNANMPADFSLNFGMDRDYFTGMVFALVFQPLAAKLFA